MEAIQYKRLTFDEQAFMVLKHGVFLQQRRQADRSRKCAFYLFGFFVEVLFGSDGKVQFIRTLTGSRHPFLSMRGNFEVCLN